MGSSRGSALAAQTGSAVPTTSQTSPGSKTPAPSVAAISSPHPIATTVSGASPLASAKPVVTVPTAFVASPSSGSIAGSIPVASNTSGDQVFVRGSSSAIEDAFDGSTAVTPVAWRRT